MGTKTKPEIRPVTLVLLLAIACTAAAGRTIYVDDDGPADFNNIQAAIDDANDGDTIIVAEGQYNESINYHGKALTLKNAEQGSPPTIEGHVDMGSDATISGFTITGGGAGAGGGIYCIGSNVEISENIIVWNTADPGYGGGLYCKGSNIIVRDNIIKHNYVGEGGPEGIYASGSNILIEGNIVSENYACGGGEGILIEGSNSIIRNNIIAWNDEADGIKCAYSSNILLDRNTIVGNSYSGIRSLRSDVTVTNCIVWGNSTYGYPGYDLSVDPSKVSYCLLSLNPELCGQNGNISEDPLFTDRDNNDYHPKSQAGRYNPNTQTWVQDDETSPCIDAGDPMTPIGPEPFPNGGVVNMGAYAGTAEASKSYFGKPPCAHIIAGDVNGDCIIDFKDAAITFSHWLEDSSP